MCESTGVLRKESVELDFPFGKGRKTDRNVELRVEFGLRGRVISPIDFLCQHGFGSKNENSCPVLKLILQNQ